MILFMFRGRERWIRSEGSIRCWMHILQNAPPLILLRILKCETWVPNGISVSAALTPWRVPLAPFRGTCCMRRKRTSGELKGEWRNRRDRTTVPSCLLADTYPLFLSHALMHNPTMWVTHTLIPESWRKKGPSLRTESLVYKITIIKCSMPPGSPGMDLNWAPSSLKAECARLWAWVFVHLHWDKCAFIMSPLTPL